MDIQTFKKKLMSDVTSVKCPVCNTRSSDPDLPDVTFTERDDILVYNCSKCNTTSHWGHICPSINKDR